MLINQLMAFLPLWSCCFGPVLKHASNAEVENFFLSVKRDQLRSKRYTVAEFGYKRYKEITNDVSEIVNFINCNATVHFFYIH